MCLVCECVVSCLFFPLHSQLSSIQFKWSVYTAANRLIIRQNTQVDKTEKMNRLRWKIAAPPPSSTIRRRITEEHDDRSQSGDIWVAWHARFPRLYEDQKKWVLVCVLRRFASADLLLLSVFVAPIVVIIITKANANPTERRAATSVSAPQNVLA